MPSEEHQGGAPGIGALCRLEDAVVTAFAPGNPHGPTVRRLLLTSIVGTALYGMAFGTGTTDSLSNSYITKFDIAELFDQTGGPWTMCINFLT